jgi:hypothetical protein
METLPKYGRQFFEADVFEGAPTARRHATMLGEIEEPARRTPVWARTEVLVAGGGPAGTAAAVAAARAGAQVMLIERYNHLGGLSTGGLVIWIDRMTDWQGEPVIRGIAEEIVGRLPPAEVAGPPRADWGARDRATSAWWAARTAAFHGVVTWSPTVSPEWLKTVSQRMVLEAGVELVHHAWVVGVLPDRHDPARVAGVLLESKQGRLAVLADVFVDATGDADLVAAAARLSPAGEGEADAMGDLVDDIDAGDIHHAINTSWLFGGVDMRAWLAFRATQPPGFAAFMAAGRAALRLFEKPFVSWRDDVALFMGPRLAGYSAVMVDDLSEVETISHRLMLRHLERYRAEAPGFAGAFPILSAPQLGVRHARRLGGVAPVTREWWDGRIAADEIGVSPSLAPKFAPVSVPYGAILPVELDGLLAPGRHLACDATSHSFLREIPQCWLTGQAAGVAAALAADAGIAPRAVEAAALQAALRGQGALLRAPAEAPVG